MRRMLEMPKLAASGVLLAALGAVACDNQPVSPPPSSPSVGSLDVTTATSGTPVTLPNYMISVAGQSLRLSSNAQGRFDSLPAGSYDVYLGGLPSNCTAEGSNPVSVTVVDDSLSSAAFTIRCELNRAWITVITTGTDIDANGYAVTMSSGTALRAAPNDTVVFTTRAPGRYGVALSNLAFNCDAAPTNPDSVTIVTEARNEIALAVTCAPISEIIGTLHVVLHTNLEGRVILVSDRGIKDSSVTTGSGELTFSNLRAGTWHVGYGANSWGCTVNGIPDWVSGWWPVSVEIAAGATTELTMDVTCLIGGP
jgi:hypothetical protein